MKQLRLLRFCNQEQILLLFHGKVERSWEFSIMAEMHGCIARTGFIVEFMSETGENTRTRIIFKLNQCVTSTPKRRQITYARVSRMLHRVCSFLECLCSLRPMLCIVQFPVLLFSSTR